jgi:hypothetical protein
MGKEVATKIEYHDFRLKKVESRRKNGRILVQWEELRFADAYQGEHTEKKVIESTYANNCKISELFLDLAVFTGNLESDNIAVTKVVLGDVGDYFDSVQFFYETDIETDNPNLVKTSKLQVQSDFGDLMKALEMKLEELKLNCWEFAVNGIKFRPETSKGEVDDSGKVTF